MDLSDLVSYTGIFYWILPFLFSLDGGQRTSSFLWGSSVLLASLLSELVKFWTRTLPYTCLKRPAGAKNCDALGQDGDQEGQPGFPSGHVATTAAFWTGAWILAPAPYKIWITVVGIGSVGAMAWARIQKHCHTGIQVAAGAVIGSLLASILVQTS